jgi:thiamine pyrophosphokinase
MSIGRIIIFSGGRLGDWALSFIQPADMLIGADSGALFLARHGITPHLAIGDFDSVTAEEMIKIRENSRKVESFEPVDKDYTDTELAFEKALSFGPQEIILTGALGTRFDHSLANIHLLVKALAKGISASILDEHNEIRIVSNRLTLTRGAFTHVSLLPLSTIVTGITLDGFQYPLTDAVLTMGQSLGISNVIIEEKAHIRLSSGLLLAIQSRD